MLVFSNSTRTRSRWWKFSAMLTGRVGHHGCDLDHNHLFMAAWLLRCHFMMCLYLDSSAARGVLSRKGVGRLRHLSCRILWMQGLLMGKRLLVRSVMGALNRVDIATKRLSAARLESLCYFLGIWRGNNLEGAHDPGNIFRHVTNQRQQGHSQAQINLLISALSVLTQLQGCSNAMASLATGGCFNAMFCSHGCWV